MKWCFITFPNKNQHSALITTLIFSFYFRHWLKKGNRNKFKLKWYFMHNRNRRKILKFKPQLIWCNTIQSTNLRNSSSMTRQYHSAALKKFVLQYSAQKLQPRANIWSRIVLQSSLQNFKYFVHECIFSMKKISPFKTNQRALREL